MMMRSRLGCHAYCHHVHWTCSTTPVVKCVTPRPDHLRSQPGSYLLHKHMLSSPLNLSITFLIYKIEVIHQVDSRIK